ncbi:phage tail family protein [Sediminivirga luteola]|uniref:Phage tail protein n=1 Tax=Sediminivirga luteola TaxID=1774748 RepID=A0A8J2TX27_9MICO|nr:phage tail family protein [Sediminivirga luteola]GGA10622.1 hypothetical protein GCM10011333_11780 [Sediminivirga luteola]
MRPFRSDGLPWLRVILRSTVGEVELTTVTSADGFVLLDGVTGLGIPKRSIESTPLPAAHGSVLRSQRLDETDMYLPVSIRGTDPDDVAQKSRRLEEVLAVASDEPVEVQVTAPKTDTTRRRYAYYVEGLEGALGGRDSHYTFRHIPLRLRALDPIWLGVTRVPGPWRVAPALKPFLSSTSESLEERRNLIADPSMASLDGKSIAGGQGQVVAGGYVGDTALQITPNPGAESVTVVLQPSPIPLGAITTASLYVRGAAQARVDIEQWSTFGSTVLGSETHTLTAAQWGRASVTQTRTATGSSVQIRAVLTAPAGGFTGPVLVDAAMLTTGTTVHDYFDGSTPVTDGWVHSWEGAPNASVSRAVRGMAGRNIPFLPVVLASSTVQGQIVVDVQGDDIAYPVWTIDAPGEDLLLIHEGTGEQLFVEGAFTEQITIDTRPQVEDIRTPTLSNGELMERIPIDKADFFHLRPGPNRLRVSMVGATPQSEINLRYDERFLAGY